MYLFFWGVFLLVGWLAHLVWCYACRHCTLDRSQTRQTSGDSTLAFCPSLCLQSLGASVKVVCFDKNAWGKDFRMGEVALPLAGLTVGGDERGQMPLHVEVRHATERARDEQPRQQLAVRRGHPRRVLFALACQLLVQSSCLRPRSVVARSEAAAPGRAGRSHTRARSARQAYHQARGWIAR